MGGGTVIFFKQNDQPNNLPHPFPNPPVTPGCFGRFRRLHLYGLGEGGEGACQFLGTHQKVATVSFQKEKNTEIVQVVFAVGFFLELEKIASSFVWSMEANTTCSFSKNQATLLMLQNCITWDDLQILSYHWKSEFEHAKQYQIFFHQQDVWNPMLEGSLGFDFPWDLNRKPISHYHSYPFGWNWCVQIIYLGKKMGIEGANRPTDLKLIQCQMAQQNYKMQNRCEYLLHWCKDLLTNQRSVPMRKSKRHVEFWQKPKPEDWWLP